LSAESKSLGNRAAEQKDIKKATDICNKLNNINKINKSLADTNNWILMQEFLPSSSQSLSLNNRQSIIKDMETRRIAQVK
jgi:hypothetical protein